MEAPWGDRRGVVENAGGVKAAELLHLSLFIAADQKAPLPKQLQVVRARLDHGLDGDPSRQHHYSVGALLIEPAPKICLTTLRRGHLT